MNPFEYEPTPYERYLDEVREQHDLELESEHDLQRHRELGTVVHGAFPGSFTAAPYWSDVPRWSFPSSQAEAL